MVGVAFGFTSPGRGVPGLGVICLCLFSSVLCAESGDKVLMQNVTHLIFYKNRTTVGLRGSESISQLQPQRDTVSVLDVVDCRSGQDRTWECSSVDLKRGQRFGPGDIHCDGFEYTSDPFISLHSCYLSYVVYGFPLPENMGQFLVTALSIAILLLVIVFNVCKWMWFSKEKVKNE